MQNLKPGLPPYHFQQKVRCVISSIGAPDEDVPNQVSYQVDVPGDKRKGILTAVSASLQPGVEVDAIFISYAGRSLQFKEFRDTDIVHRPSDKDMISMSIPLQSSLVTVEVLEKSGEHYNAVFKDYWGNPYQGPLVSSQRLATGDLVEVAVAGWNSRDLSFILVEDVEREIARQNGRAKYFSGTEKSQDALDRELDWMAAIVSLADSGANDTIFGPMINEAEVLIANIQKEGLSKHWDATVEALKLYTWPKEAPEISRMLQELVDEFTEKDVIEFLSFRLHPSKECPLTPMNRNIIQRIAADKR